jgi:hypothetical protein
VLGVFTGEKMMEKGMRWRWVVACGVVALAACATREGPGGGGSGGGEPDGEMKTGHTRHNDPVCNASTCVIDVRIDCKLLLTCVAVVDPKVLVVEKGDATPKKIIWKLKGMDSGYTFKDEPIKLPAPFQECERPGEAGKQIMCKDNLAQSSPLTVFEYALHVVNANGSELTIDPWIVNR